MLVLLSLRACLNKHKLNNFDGSAYELWTRSCSDTNDPGCAQVHAGDNSRLNESSSVMVEAYKKNQQSRKHTRSTRIIHIQRQYARI